MLPSLSPWAAAALLVILAFASYARGYSGFGFTALLVTGGALIVDPARIVPLAMLMEVVASVVQFRGVWDDVDWKRFWVILIGSAVTVPLGVLALAWLNADATRIVLSCYVAAMSLAMLSGWRLRRPIGTPSMLVVSAISGVITGIVGMGGLFIVSFMTADGSRPAAIRATMIAYFLPLDIYAAGLYAWRGFYDGEILTAAVIALPILMAGMVVGRRFFLATTPETFRRYTLGLLLVLAAGGIVRSLAW